MYDEHKIQVKRLKTVLAQADSLQAYATAVAAMQVLLKSQLDSLSDLEKDSLLTKIFCASAGLPASIEKEHREYLKFINQELEAEKSYR